MSENNELKRAIETILALAPETEWPRATERIDSTAWLSAESLAKEFHETYERLAPEHGYKTREESAVAWEDVPAANKNLMIAVCDHLLSR